MTAVQYLVQLALVAAAIALPGLIAMNTGARRAPRLPLGWQLVILLAIAMALAGSPWTGCADCR